MVFSNLVLLTETLGNIFKQFYDGYGLFSILVLVVRVLSVHGVLPSSPAIVDPKFLIYNLY